MPRGAQKLLLFEINRDNEKRSPTLKLVKFDQNKYWPNAHVHGVPGGILLESVFLSSSPEKIFNLKNFATGKISSKILMALTPFVLYVPKLGSLCSPTKNLLNTFVPKPASSIRSLIAAKVVFSGSQKTIASFSGTRSA